MGSKNNIGPSNIEAISEHLLNIANSTSKHCRNIGDALQNISKAVDVDIECNNKGDQYEI